MRNTSSMRSNAGRHRDAHAGSDVSMAANDTTTIWSAFFGELERAYRPFGRASVEARMAAWRLARHMAAAHTAPDQIRHELSRAVRAHAMLVGLDDTRNACEGRCYDAFLADVLRAAVVARPSVSHLSVVQTRSGAH